MPLRFPAEYMAFRSIYFSFPAVWLNFWQRWLLVAETQFLLEYSRVQSLLGSLLGWPFCGRVLLNLLPTHLLQWLLVPDPGNRCKASGGREVPWII